MSRARRCPGVRRRRRGFSCHRRLLRGRARGTGVRGVRCRLPVALEFFALDTSAGRVLMRWPSIVRRESLHFHSAIMPLSTAARQPSPSPSSVKGEGTCGGAARGTSNPLPVLGEGSLAPTPGGLETRPYSEVGVGGRHPHPDPLPVLGEGTYRMGSYWMSGGRSARWTSAMANWPLLMYSSSTTSSTS